MTISIHTFDASVVSSTILEVLSDPQAVFNQVDLFQKAFEECILIKDNHTHFVVVGRLLRRRSPHPTTSNKLIRESATVGIFRSLPSELYENILSRVVAYGQEVRQLIPYVNEQQHATDMREYYGPSTIALDNLIEQFTSSNQK
jgi:hypothetical protein